MSTACEIPPALGRATRRRFIAQAAGGLGLFAALDPLPAAARELKRGEFMLVPPTLAHAQADGRLALRVEAWVCERERTPKRTALLARALGLDLDEVPAPDRALYLERTALFGNDAKAGRTLRLLLAGAPTRVLPPTAADGRLRALVPLPPQAVPGDPGGSGGSGASGASGASGSWIDFTLESGDQQAPARARALPDEGLSVVSDIDDTIKHTLVRQRREMLLNTFARPFTAVPGMAEWYARIDAASPGAAFHYVSGSPWQLLPPLAAFIADARFPAGSLHPRVFRLRPDALLDAAATGRHKIATIKQLLADFPRRRLLLVGDSGERDPETYGEIARAHPERVAAVLIRDVTGEPASAARYATAFARVPSAAWQLFSEPGDLAARWA